MAKTTTKTKKAQRKLVKQPHYTEAELLAALSQVEVGGVFNWDAEGDTVTAAAKKPARSK